MSTTFKSLAILAGFLSFSAMAAFPAQAQLQNPCPSAWAGDGDCDEPNGLNLCDWGTDATDCSNPASNFGSGAGFSAGVYTGGGGGGSTTALLNPCPFTGDNDCDEPNGLNLCDWGTDATDCSNPSSNFANGPGFSAGIYAAAPPPVAPPPVAPPVIGGGGGGGGFSGGFVGGGGGSTGSFVSSGGGGTSGCPNFGIQNTAFGQGTLQAGGALNPVRVPRITAGGRFPLTNCFPGTNWRGFTITRPDYRFFYQGNSPTGRLTFSLFSNRTDTILLINTPDGQWHFNDDSNGTSNSTLTFSPVLQGQYDIWAGAFNQSSNNAAELWISEQ